MNLNHRLPPQVSALLCPLGSGLSLREPSLTFALGRGLGSSREKDCCPVAPRSWVIGFLPWVDIAQLSPWSVLSEMLVPGGPRVVERREGLRTGASWGPRRFPEKFPNQKGCVWSRVVFIGASTSVVLKRLYVPSRLPSSRSLQRSGHYTTGSKVIHSSIF